MLGLTGFQDYREMAQSLFHVLALLEIEGQAFVNTDQSMVKKLLEGQQKQYIPIQPSITHRKTKDELVDVETNENQKQIDRMQSYMDLLKELKISEASKKEQIVQIQKQLKDLQKKHRETLNYYSAKEEKPKIEEKKCNKHKEIDDISITQLDKLANCAVSQELATKLFSEMKELN